MRGACVLVILRGGWLWGASEGYQRVDFVQRRYSLSPRARLAVPVFSRCRASLVHCLVSSPRDHSLSPLCPVASLDSPHDHSLLDLTRRVVKHPKERHTHRTCTLDTLCKHTLFKQTLTLLLPPPPSLFFFAVHCSRFPLPCKLSSRYSRPHCAASRRAWAPQSKLLLCHDTYHHTQKRDRSENSHIERAARRRRFDSMTNDRNATHLQPTR